MDNECRSITYREISVGDQASFPIKITDQLVDDFGHYSGNLNPLHMDEAYGAKTEFSHRIAFGMMAGSFFSRLLGMYLPGEYSLCLSQTLQFHHPIMINADVVVRGEVLQKIDAFNTILVRTTVEDAATKKVLVGGEALVKVLK
jgi:3-hydroxybutyryl-CoA dehydratase